MRFKSRYRELYDICDATRRQYAIKNVEYRDSQRECDDQMKRQIIEQNQKKEKMFRFDYTKDDYIVIFYRL